MKATACALMTAALCAGCSSLNDSALFAGGRDGRAFNAQMGRYEWSEEAPGATPRQRRVSLREEPAEQAAGRQGVDPRDSRIYNQQSGRYEWPDDRD